MEHGKAQETQHPQQMADPESQAWHKLPWQALEQKVHTMQKRIYQASQRGDTSEVHSQQQLLMESEAARLWAVHHVTQDNEGKDTAGVDGVKSVPPKDRFVLTSTIHPDHWSKQPPKPVLRVWIPKPGSTELRPLGILTVLDRCKQTLAKMALEPEWEAQFEPHSYGFRPGRGTHDAITAIKLTIDQHPSFVFDADIEKAFDHINQTLLLDKLQTFPALREAINAWLKAGVMDHSTYFPSEIGIPQGGALSPLLMNVALHGMETVVKDSDTNELTIETPLVIRYADDFLIFHSNLERLQKAASKITEWLKTMGLNLNAKKTHITHTLSSYQGHLGFDFLGFTIQHYPPEPSESESSHICKTVIIPSEKARHHHLAIIAEQLDHLGAASQAQIIHELNPIIAGWATYYSGFVSSHSLSTYDELVKQMLLKWAKQHHPNKDAEWLLSHYWHPIGEGEGEWIFSTPDGVELSSHAHPTARTPYDGGCPSSFSRHGPSASKAH